MSKPPPLTAKQKKALKKLHPQLKNAALSGDYNSAQRIVGELQELLRPTGHETRLMKAKTLLFQAALASGDTYIAELGFIGIRRKTSAKSTTHVQSTALLAVCYLKMGKTKEAEPLMKEALKNTSAFKSEKRRRNFRSTIIRLFEEEAALFTLRGNSEDFTPEQEIESEAGRLVQTRTEDEIFERLGQQAPPTTVNTIMKINEFTKKQLPENERKLLPSPDDPKINRHVGRTMFSCFKHALWKSLCTEESLAYQTLTKYGPLGIVGLGILGKAIKQEFNAHGFASKGAIIAVTALIFKVGLDTICLRIEHLCVVEDLR